MGKCTTKKIIKLKSIIHNNQKAKLMETIKKLSIVQKIESTSHSQLANLPEVADRFIHLYSVFNGRNLEFAKLSYEAEKFHFMKLLQDKPDLQKCTKLSLYGCFIDMAVQGLSFDPAMKHAYVVGFPTNIGTKQDPKWETRATLMIDGRGELVIRTKQGQIKYADNPVVVWDCDDFAHGTKGGAKFVDHSAVHPRPKDAEIIACYLKITRPDGTIDYCVLDIEDVMALREFSKQPNSLAWTKGLRGMVETKTLKHAFKSYPKVKLGNFSKLQTEVIEPADEIDLRIDYGLNGSTPSSTSNKIDQKQSQPETNPDYADVQDDDFVTETGSQGNSITVDDDDF